MQQAHPSLWNIPNALTMLRLVLVPVFAWVLLSHPNEVDWRLWATLVFCVAIVTDALDGRIARHYGLVTNFGKLVDPIADKALTGMAFVGLSVIGELWWWVTIVILIREFGITVLRFFLTKYGIVMAANKGGKAKTFTQSIALILLLLPLSGLWKWPGWLVMAAALILTLTSGIEYCYLAAKLRNEQKTIASS